MMKKKIVSLFLVLTCAISMFMLPVHAVDGGVDMYRLYNPNSGEHFYTSNASERDNLRRVGWNYEGIGWVAPNYSEYPVYRLYNQYGGEHHYTLSVDEKNNLIRLGWKDEGIGWYSANPNDASSIPLKREYNPNAFANNHNYTTSVEEHNYLVSLGWRDEGNAWYAIGYGRAEGDTNNSGNNSNSENVVVNCRNGGNHNWANWTWEDRKNGYACNQCYKDVTDYEDMYDCHGGYHTQTWYNFPSYYKCSTCGKYLHKHQWSWVKPMFGSDDAIVQEGYWKCWRCGAQSSNGNRADAIMTTSEGYEHGSKDWWTTPFNFEKDANEWIVEDEWWDKADNTLYLQSITIKSMVSMAVGDTYQYAVKFTPANPVEGKEVKWSSDNENVVQIDRNGKAIAVGEGKATITSESSGCKDTSVIRVTEENVGYVKSAELHIKNSNDEEIIMNPNGVINVEKGKYIMYLKTNPEQAVYTVRYNLSEVENRYYVANISGRIECSGGTSEYAWNQGIQYTNSESNIEFLNTGNVTLYVTECDVNGNEIKLQQEIHVN